MFSQLMFFHQVTEARDADPVGDTVHTASNHKISVQRGYEEGFFHEQVGQAKPQLNDVDAQHGLQVERRTPPPSWQVECAAQSTPAAPSKAPAGSYRPNTRLCAGDDCSDTGQGLFAS